MAGKIRVAVLYGGRSGEHEVSLRSAASVLRHLDRTRFEPIPIGIDKQGKWHLPSPSFLAQAEKLSSLPIEETAEVILPARPGASLATAGGVPVAFDVVFPVMHGTLCEDGTLQGLFELADIAYVGSGVLSSSVGMDKDMSKRVVREAGLPVAPYLSVRKPEFEKSFSRLAAQVKEDIGYPCFVKPSNSGSSVGVHKAKDEAGLRAALTDAFLYDVKVLIETAINAREIELSVLENPVYGEPPLVSIAGEVIPQHEFYSYEAKYLDENGAKLEIPSRLTAHQMQEAQALAGRIFEALEGEGLARVDLFLDRNTNEFYFNEINTLPGFTSISMYPKMWEASGIGYSELLTRLVDLAIARQKRKLALLREFKPS